MPIENDADAFAGIQEISRKEVVRRVIRAAKERRAFSLIRLGEGEARLLAASASDEMSLDVARRKIRRQTGIKVPDSSVLEIRGLIVKAVNGSDIIGVLADAKFNDEHRAWAEIATRHVYEQLERSGNPAAICHCLVNGNLHESLPSFIGYYRKVTVIGCRNVEPVIKSMAPDIDCRMLPIPSQFVKRDLVDGDFERGLYDTPMWPDAYRGLVEDPLVREPGELFLIGAGLFGKSLCALVKEQGGMGLDLGSRIDFMVGKRTRGESKRAALALQASSG